jgi:hypothetical protein
MKSGAVTTDSQILRFIRCEDLIFVYNQSIEKACKITKIKATVDFIMI